MSKAARLAHRLERRQPAVARPDVVHGICRGPRSRGSRCPLGMRPVSSMTSARGGDADAIPVAPKGDGPTQAALNPLEQL